MVSSEAWKYVSLHLQDILQNKLLFGGVNIIAISDLFQLQPVKSNFIFMDLKHNYGPLATNLWCEYFNLFELTEIMHQKDDKELAEILNRLHMGIHTKKDIGIIETKRVTQEQSEQLHHITHFFLLERELKVTMSLFWKHHHNMLLLLQLLISHQVIFLPVCKNKYKVQ